MLEALFCSLQLLWNRNYLPGLAAGVPPLGPPPAT